MSKFRFVASSGPSAEELKEPVNKDESLEIINYKGTYAIRFNELRNLGLNYFDDIVLMCQNKGLEDPAFFGRACLYCQNSTTNLDDLVELSDGEPFILNKISRVNCTYHPDKEIKVASTYTSKDKKQKPFYAIRSERCAFEDSLISYLIDNGLLESFKVGIEFIFRPLKDFKPGEVITEEYLCENVVKLLPKESSDKKGLIGYLKRLFRR